MCGNLDQRRIEKGVRKIEDENSSKDGKGM